jgi:hypothetical protein
MSPSHTVWSQTHRRVIAAASSLTGVARTLDKRLVSQDRSGGALPPFRSPFQPIRAGWFPLGLLDAGQGSGLPFGFASVMSTDDNPTAVAGGAGWHPTLERGLSHPCTLLR